MFTKKSLSEKKIELSKAIQACHEQLRAKEQEIAGINVRINQFSGAILLLNEQIGQLNDENKVLVNEEEAKEISPDVN